MPLRRLALILALAAGLSAGPAWTVLAATDLDERRVRIGLRLFRTALAADVDLADKRAADGSLRLIIVYRSDGPLAERAAAELTDGAPSGEPGRLFAWPMSVETLAADAFPGAAADPAAGVFIAEDLDDAQLHRLIDYGIAHRLVVYSAVEGHVERGVPLGLDVGVRVLPYVNDRTLEASQLQLKNLFLKVAKHHE